MPRQVQERPFLKFTDKQRLIAGPDMLAAYGELAARRAIANAYEVKTPRQKMAARLVPWTGSILDGAKRSAATDPMRYPLIANGASVEDLVTDIDIATEIHNSMLQYIPHVEPEKQAAAMAAIDVDQIHLQLPWLLDEILSLSSSLSKHGNERRALFENVTNMQKFLGDDITSKPARLLARHPANAPTRSILARAILGKKYKHRFAEVLF